MLYRKSKPGTKTIYYINNKNRTFIDKNGNKYSGKEVIFVEDENNNNFFQPLSIYKKEGRSNIKFKLTETTEWTHKTVNQKTSMKSGTFKRK